MTNSRHFILCLFITFTFVAQTETKTYLDDSYVKEISSVLEAYKVALKEMKSDEFIGLFYNPLSPIYGIYKKDGVDVNIDLHASNFINQFIWQKKTAWQVFRNVTITSDGIIGVLNADFEFYYEGSVSNWGRESWHLIKTEKGWKILSIIFSKRPSEEPLYGKRY